MAGKDVWCVVEESATIACHCVLLAVSHLQLGVLFDASGHPNRTIVVNAVVYIEPCFEHSITLCNIT